MKRRDSVSTGIRVVRGNWSQAVKMARSDFGNCPCCIELIHWLIDDRDIKDFSKANKNLRASRVFTHHSAVVNDVEFHPELAWAVATVSDDLSLQILDLRQATNTHAAKSVPRAHSDAINSVSFNPGNETILATGSADKTVAIWDMRNLTAAAKLHSCEAHKDVVSQVEWHPFERAIVASSSYDRRIIFWDLSRCGEELTPEDAEDGPPEL